MTRFTPVNLFVYSGKQVYSLTGEDPVDLPSQDYSTLRVIPTYDGSGIGEVSASYVYGPEEGDYISSIYSSQALTGLTDLIQAEGSTLLERVIDFNRSFSSDDAKQILSIFPVLGSVTEQRLVDAFAIGIAGLFGYIGMMLNPDLWEKDRMPFPFYFELPTSHRDPLSLVQKPLFAYLDLVGQVVLAINDESTGQRWMEHLLNFWSVWQDALPDGNESTRASIIQEGTQAASKGLAGYIGEITTSLSDRYRHLNDELKHATDRLRCQRDEAIIACRFHKQGHFEDLQTAKEAILEEFDRKAASIRCLTEESMRALKEANQTILTEELEKYRSCVIEQIEDVKHSVIEEIVRVKDECIQSMGSQDLVLSLVRQALREDSLIQGYVKELLRPVIEEERVLTERCRATSEKYTMKGEQEDRLSRMEGELRRIENKEAKNSQWNIHSREEIEQLKTEMVSLRHNFDRILRLRIGHA